MNRRVLPSDPPVPVAARYGLPVLIAGLVFASFVPVLDNGFVNWDDPYYFLGNPNYLGLTTAHLRWMFTTLYMGHYQPLSWLTHALVYAVWGMDPRGYHLVNLLLHTANAVVCYFLIAALLRRSVRGIILCPLTIPVAAAVGALLFAIHPLRVEAVAWAAERQEVLAATFFLLTVVTYLRAVDTEPEGNRRGWYVLSLSCFGLSLLSKASGVMLPVVLLLLDAYPLCRFTARRPQYWTSVLVEKIPYAVLATAAAGVALLGAHSAGMSNLQKHGLVERAMQAAYGLCFYVRKTLAPGHLSPLYLLKRPLDPTEPRYFVSALVVIAGTGGLLLLRSRHAWAWTAWACYVVIVSPLLGFLQTGPQLVADRYSYLSCVPWAVLAAAGICHLWRVSETRPSLFFASAATVVLALLALGIRTYKQTSVWRDSLTLWNHVLQIDPTNYMAYNSRGDARLDVHAADPRIARANLKAALTDYSHALFFCPPNVGYRAIFEANVIAARRKLGTMSPQPWPQEVK